MTTTHRAKRISTNQWLQTVDAFDPPESEVACKTRLAATFGLPESDVMVVTSDWTVTQRETAAAELASGTHEGLPVIAAGKIDTTDQDFAHDYDPNRLLKACMLVTLDAVNQVRTDPLTVRPAITSAAWRQAILTKYKTL